MLRQGARLSAIAGWFHISTQFLGRSVVLEPRLPQAPAVGEEKLTPRISVAASVEQCLAGLTALKLPPRAYVYRVHGPVKQLDTDTPAKVVPDWAKSEEAWILSPQRFRYVGAIRCETSATVDLRSGAQIGEEIVWKWVEDDGLTPNG